MSDTEGVEKIKGDIARRRYADNMNARAEVDLAEAGLSPKVIAALLAPDDRVYKDRKAPVLFTRPIQAQFLALLSVKGLAGKCAHAVGVSTDTTRRHRKSDPVFAEAYEEALEIYRDRIRETVHNRAVEGWEEPVFYQGELVATIRKFSDRLLELHAKARVPEYRDQVDVNVGGGVLVVGAQMAPDEWVKQFGGRVVAKAVENEANKVARG